MNNILENYTKNPIKLVCDHRLPKPSDNFTNVLNYFKNSPVKIKVESRSNCTENNCHNNVDLYVSMYGGNKITGYYLVYDMDNNRFIAIRHSIWKNTYEDLVDITKFSDNREWNLFIESDRKESILFI